MFSMTIQVQGDRATRRALKSVPDKLSKGVSRAMLKEANYLMKEIRTGIRNQAPGGQPFKKLSKSTIRKRKIVRGRASRKALIDTATLLKSVNVHKITLGGKTAQLVFVGVHRKERSADGKQLSNIAEHHEFGTKPFTIPVTPAMRFYWNNVLWVGGAVQNRLSTNTNVLRHPGIPARPYLRPAFALWRKEAPWRWLGSVFKEAGLPQSTVQQFGALLLTVKLATTKLKGGK